MAIRDHLPVFAIGTKRQVHYECRACGENLGPGQDQCPECSGDVIGYEL